MEKSGIEWTRLLGDHWEVLTVPLAFLLPYLIKLAKFGYASDRKELKQEVIEHVDSKIKDSHELLVTLVLQKLSEQREKEIEKLEELFHERLSGAKSYLSEKYDSHIRDLNKSVDTGLNNMTDNIRAVGVRVDKVETSVDSIDARVQGVFDRVSDMRNDLATQQTTVEFLKTEVWQRRKK